MLGLLLIYFIGKRFYDLATEFNQNKWLFAILSVIIYYVAGFILGIVLFVLDVYIFNWDIDWDNNFGINLLGIPAGLLAVWGFYTILENRWKKTTTIIKDEVDNIGKPV
ncbi:MAG: hypothetical protein ACK5NB_00765 [Flavobacteriaceae bacterium]